MRIRIYSDLHLEFAPFVPPSSDADVIVLAGDIDNGAAGIEWARGTFGKPVLYLAGNHEYYEGEFEAVQQAMGAAARKLAVERLDCSGVILDGVRFLGCTLWIHGHTHTFFDYRAGGARVICNPRGYPGEATGFRPDLIVEI